MYVQVHIRSYIRGIVQGKAKFNRKRGLEEKRKRKEKKTPPSRIRVLICRDFLFFMTVCSLALDAFVEGDGGGFFPPDENTTSE